MTDNTSLRLYAESTIDYSIFPQQHAKQIEQSKIKKTTILDVKYI